MREVFCNTFAVSVLTKLSFLASSNVQCPPLAIIYFSTPTPPFAVLYFSTTYIPYNELYFPPNAMQTFFVTTTTRHIALLYFSTLSSPLQSNISPLPPFSLIWCCQSLAMLQCWTILSTACNVVVMAPPSLVILFKVAALKCCSQYFFLNTVGIGTHLFCTKSQICLQIISSVRSSYSHPDLLLIHHHHHPTFSDHTGPQHWTFTFWATTAI